MDKRGGLVAIMLVSVGWLLWERGRPEPLEDPALTLGLPEIALAPEAGPPALLSEPLPVEDLEPGVVESARQIVTKAPPAAEESPPPPDAPGLLVRGTVVVLEQDGREVLDAQGSFALVLWRGKGGRHHEVTYENGHFETVLETPETLDSLSLSGLTRDGVPIATVSPTDRFGPSETLRVVGRVPAPSTLLVVDAESGADLSQIMLVNAESFPRDDLTHPGVPSEERLVAQDLRSPIQLGTWLEVLDSEFLVGATGYAWARVSMDFLQGGERRVALSPSGTITVDCTSVDPNSAAQLRLRRADVFYPIVEIALRKDGALQLEGLAPGAYEIAAEIGEFYDSPIVLGSVNSELRVSEHVRVALDLNPAPNLEYAPMGGIAYIPEEWGKTKAQIVLELLDTPLGGFDGHRSAFGKRIPNARAGYEAFEFNDPEMQVGRYELGVYEPAFSIVVDLPSGGRDDFELVVPPPVELLVHVALRTSGATVISDDLKWYPTRPDGVSGGGLANAPYDPKREAHVVRAPLGEVQLMLWSEEYQPYRGTVDLRGGTLEHTIELELACGFSLRMKDDETPIRFPESWHGHVKSEGGSGRNTLTHHNADMYTFMVSEPGIYTIEMPEILGYEKPAVQRIEVFAETIVEHVVSLQRK